MSRNDDDDDEKTMYGLLSRRLIIIGIIVGFRSSFSSFRLGYHLRCQGWSRIVVVASFGKAIKYSAGNKHKSKE